MNWKIEADNLRKTNPKHILFLCVANSARSQMAEGIARSLAPKTVRISSAGSNPSRVNPLAIEVLSEISIDISSHKSKIVDDVDTKTVDAVITLCTEEVCPAFLGKATRLHWGLTDPSGSIDSFRKVRDELVSRLTYLFKNWDLEEKETIKSAVRYNYAKIATSNSSCGCSSSTSCCSSTKDDYKKISMGLGYSTEDVEGVPEGANMGLGCGNPKAFSDLKK